MTISDDVKSEQDRKVAAAEEKAAKYRRERDLLKNQLGRATSEREEIENLLDAVTAIEESHRKPPPWKRPRKKKAGHHATACFFLSDTHFDEIVNPSEVNGANAYNREIAELRLKTFFERGVTLARTYTSGVTYDGAWLNLGGDIISGWIHDELAETNEGGIMESALYWIDPLSALVGGLADEFGALHVTGQVGNHDRLHRKPRMKHGARHSVAYLMYRLLARDFADDDRITFDFPDGFEQTVDVYDTSFLCEHGDAYRGGSGIAGMMSPLMLGHHRTSRREMALDRSFDYLALGHWHQLWMGKGIIVNGSLKGYDEFASKKKFEPEPPQQWFWLTTPERGLTMRAPIFCAADRKAEGW